MWWNMKTAAAGFNWHDKPGQDSLHSPCVISSSPRACHCCSCYSSCYCCCIMPGQCARTIHQRSARGPAMGRQSQRRHSHATDTTHKQIHFKAKQTPHFHDNQQPPPHPPPTTSHSHTSTHMLAHKRDRISAHVSIREHVLLLRVHAAVESAHVKNAVLVTCD
jgi:hypothetical protein